MQMMSCRFQAASFAARTRADGRPHVVGSRPFWRSWDEARRSQREARLRAWMRRLYQRHVRHAGQRIGSAGKEGGAYGAQIMPELRRRAIALLKVVRHRPLYDALQL